MKVYVLTKEPYHDNSSVLGIFFTAEEPLRQMEAEAVRRNADPRPNKDDWHLSEWDTDIQEPIKRWELRPMRLDYRQSPGHDWKYHQPVDWAVGECGA